MVIFQKIENLLDKEKEKNNLLTCMASPQVKINFSSTSINIIFSSNISLKLWRPAEKKLSCQSKSIFHQHQSNINLSSTLSLKLWQPAEQKLSCQSKINLSSTSIKHQLFTNCQFEIVTASRAEFQLSIKNQYFLNINQTSICHQFSIWNWDGRLRKSWVVNRKSIFQNINQTSTFHQLSIWDRENEQSISCVINL